MGADTVNLIQTLGFPVVAAAAAGIFGYKVVFYILKTVTLEIKELHTIIVKLIDRLNGHDKETNKLSREIAQLRSEVGSLYKCMGVDPRRQSRKGEE